MYVVETDHCGAEDVVGPRRVLRRAGDLLTAQREELADGMTREMGKPLIETRGDVPAPPFGPPSGVVGQFD